MIPKITQSSPNIVERYWCGTCGASLSDPYYTIINPQGSRWKYCPFCGELIEYDKATPVQWAEKNCELCNRWMIKKMESGPRSYFIDSGDYVGASICRSCMEEHCAQTNCLQCEIGRQPDCPYSLIKKWAVQHSNNT